MGSVSLPGTTNQVLHIIFFCCLALALALIPTLRVTD